MKKRLLLYIISVTVLCTGVHASAENEDIIEAEKAIPESVREICGRVEDDGKYDTGGAVSRLFDSFMEKLEEALRKEVNVGASITGIGIATSLAMAFCNDGKMRTFINALGVCALAALLVGDVDSIISSTAQTLTRLSDYSKTVIPPLFTAAAAGGAAVSAPAKYAAVCFALDVLMKASDTLLVPLVYAYTALSISSGLFDNSALAGMKRIIKWCSVTVMTALTIAFTAFIGVTGTITGSADALAIKTARTVISGTLPVVGGIISDTAGTVLNAAALIRNSTGAMAMAAVCALCIGPFAMMLAKSLIFKAGSALCGMVPGISMSCFLDDIGTAVNLMMGLVGSTCLILFISIASAMRTVTG